MIASTDFIKGLSPTPTSTINPSGVNTSATVVLPATKYKVSLTGGNVPELGGDGAITYVPIRSLQLGPQEAVILLNKP